MELKYYTFTSVGGKWVVDGLNVLRPYPSDTGARLRVFFDKGKPIVWDGATIDIGSVWTVDDEALKQPVDTTTAWDKQVGGGHYTDMAIQPFEFSMGNKLDPMQHTIIKYVTRFRAKNGVQDLEKARHVIDLLIEWENSNATEKSNP